MEQPYSQDFKGDSAVAMRDLDLQDVVKDHIEVKYQGTDEDKLDMKVLGRSQETRRMFSTISMLGFGSTLS
jgi:hypothetical protein